MIRIASRVTTHASPSSDRPVTRTGIVGVHRFGIGDNQASCSCDWSAPRRRLKAAACQDAWTHSAVSRC